MNPYEAPIPTENAASVVDDVGSGASLIWYAGTVASATYLLALLSWLHRVGGATVFQFDADHLATVFISDLLISVCCFTVPAVVIYVAVRQVLLPRLGFRSTALSQVFSGSLTAVYFLAMMHAARENYADDRVIFGLAILLGFPLVALLIAAESRIAMRNENAKDSDVIPVVNNQSASVLWFSAAGFSLSFLILLMLNARFPDQTLSNMLKQTFQMACFASVLATAFHCVVGVCHVRPKPATIQSRLIAAVSYWIVYIALVWLIGYRLRVVAGGSVYLELLLFLLVIPLLTAMLSVTVDRVLGSRARSPS